MEDKDDLKGIDHERDEIPKDENPDDYGLPHVKYDPLEKEDHLYDQDLNDHGTYKREKYYEYEEKSGSRVFVILLILLLLGGIGFGVYWFQFRDSDTSTVVTDDFSMPPPPVVEEVYEEPAYEPVEEFPLPVAKTTGDLSTISNRSGSYYIVVGSFIDDDLAKDHSDRLNAQGMDTYLIEPSNNRKFYRLAVASFGSLSDATDRLEDLKHSFGQEIWVLRH